MGPPLNAVEIEEAVSELARQPFDAGGFPFAFLRAFGLKDVELKRLEANNAFAGRRAKPSGSIDWKAAPSALRFALERHAAQFEHSRRDPEQIRHIGSAIWSIR